ncbi:putative DNA-binding protein [Bergeyella zoohelcum]|uniref:Putative DNA-binding protein n=2 Tax=Bergeyella zoohelcum TaxID=1015 RepID=A0A7Z8YQN1_9FLAO|nr:putative DNA-binding protein [Bergeyella zoohelcum]
MKFKSIQKAQPGVSGGGDKKYYANPVYTGEITLDQLTEKIEKISTVSGADIRAVLYALVDIIPSELANSQIVRVGELGSFRVSISSEGKVKEEEVTANSIKSSKILFTPGTKLKAMQNNLKFEKA